MSDTPRFHHEACDGCRFVGTTTVPGVYVNDDSHLKRDVWVCPQMGFPTVIFRWGNAGPDYESGRHLLVRLPSRLRERALELLPGLADE